MKITDSSPNASAAPRATATCPRCGGSKLPPNSATRRSRPPAETSIAEPTYVARPRTELGGGGCLGRVGSSITSASIRTGL